MARTHREGHVAEGGRPAAGRAGRLTGARKAPSLHLGAPRHPADEGAEVGSGAGLEASKITAPTPKL